MTKPLTLVVSVTIALLALQACNPECESIPASNIELPPGPYEKGAELAIFANPSELLKGRDFLLSVRNINTNNTSTITLESRYEEGLEAAVVTLPDEINQDATFLINDPDCSGQLIPIGTQTSVVDASFFVDNPFFITPTPPLIIIPSPPINPPLKIINAWFSPNNRDYCIWFKPDEDEDGNEKPNLIPAIATSPMTITNGPPNGSAELAVGCGGNPATDRFYHANPVSGIVDKENNYIRILIDRTSKGLGIEEMVGQFINPDMLPPNTDYSTGGRCNPDGSKKPNIMLLTSLQTGRQMILWRDAD
ncbi:MAG: hypothetical protein R2824_15570 [Saprospiraceae bacterium]|nr:hypothetical protein [Lewinella sp.]